LFLFLLSFFGNLRLFQRLRWLGLLEFRGLDQYLPPKEGALQGGGGIGGPEHEFGLDAKLKKVSHVRNIIEFKGLREAYLDRV
jgi:hypothetical protein